MSERCHKCGSTKVIPKLQILDQGQYSDGQLQAVGYAKPEAWVFKGRVYARLNATICGTCGHTEITAENPEALYEAYVSSLAIAQVVPEPTIMLRECPCCERIIPPNDDRCAKCGWSYLDQPAE